MTRKECLESAAKAVLTDRSQQYGEPEDSFRMIARLWSVYLDYAVRPCDVAAMMALLKIARLGENPLHADSWVDLAGYAACGAECVEKGGYRIEAVDELNSAADKAETRSLKPDEIPATGEPFGHGFPLKTM